MSDRKATKARSRSLWAILTPAGRVEWETVSNGRDHSFHLLWLVQGCRGLATDRQVDEWVADRKAKGYRAVRCRVVEE